MSTNGVDTLVSIIVPIYNIHDYIGRCIESIEKQTYKNIEILLINDGSKDKSRDICEEYARNDKRIRIVDKKNGGLSDARNWGIDVAKGEYIVFVDGDDYIRENYIEILLKSIESTNAEVCLCSFDIVGDDGNILKTEILSELNGIVHGHDILAAVLTNYGYKYVVAWNKIYSRHVFDKVRFDKGKIYEDEYINFRLFWDCNKVGIIKTPLYCYVQRFGSITQSSMSIDKIKMKNEMHRRRIQFYKDKQDKNLLTKSCQLYCNWLVECVRQYSNIIPGQERKIMQKDMRRYVRIASNNTEINRVISVQNYLGRINLFFAAKAKDIYRKNDRCE